MYLGGKGGQVEGGQVEGRGENGMVFWIVVVMVAAVVVVCRLGCLSVLYVGIFNSLTVEHARCPGRNFKRKVLSKYLPPPFRCPITACR